MVHSLKQTLTNKVLSKFCLINETKGVGKENKMPLTHSPDRGGESGKPPNSPTPTASTRRSRTREDTSRASSQDETSKQTWKMIKEKSGGGAAEQDLDKLWTGETHESESTVKGCDSETCKKCLKKVKNNQMGVICDYCQIWFHNECVNINRGEYKMLNELENKVKWYCEDCSELVSGMQQENNELKREKEILKKQNQNLMKYMEQLIELKDDIEQMEERLESKIDIKVDKRLNKAIAKKEEQILKKVNDAHLRYEEHLRDQLKQLGSDTATEIRKLEQKNKQQKLEAGELEHIKRQVVDKCVQEIDQKKKQDESDELEMKKTKESQMRNIETKLESLEKEKRKKNLVIYNLQESNKTEPSQRYNEDREHIQKIFTQELLRDGFRVERIIRLGKKTEGNRRPTLVVMRSEEEKMDVLVNAKRMRHSTDYPKLYINKDLTVSERMKEKQLREQLREKRNKGETGYTIKKGKLINKPSGMSLGRDENNNEVSTNNDVAEDGGNGEVSTNSADLEEERGAVGGARRKTTGNFW